MYLRIKDITLIVLLAISTSLALGQKTIGLTGEWQVKLDPRNKGIEELWFNENTFAEHDVVKKLHTYGK